jgi:hypothetical protein
MKYLLIPLLLLTGCSTVVPVAMKFPDVPVELTAACSELDKTPAGTTKLSDTIDVVVKNYSKYHECRAKVDAWTEWHKTQKQIFENVK